MQQQHEPGVSQDAPGFVVPEQGEAAAATTAHDLFGASFPEAERYVKILGTRGVEWGLIGPRESGRLWERHVVNSLAIVPFVSPDASVIDVGSGAGLPGIPLALARPDLQITLLEPLERRARFLSLAVEELDLSDRVRVVRGRAEEHDASYDVVTCRAVAALTKLLAWTAPLFAGGGCLVALKGASASEDLAKAGKELKKRGLSGRVESVSVYRGSEPTWVTVVEASHRP